ncbi:MAG TPA: Smr/MutS family protein [Burkholderiales bacterium]|nr:Smr/MutS family protein [Burkholderiales bacterium]
MNRDSDRELFLDAVEGAVPLKAKARAETGKKPLPERREPAKEESVADYLSDHVSFDEEETAFSRPGLSKILKKLKRGGIPIEGELDLHGMTLDEAKKTLLAFLELSRGMRVVRIIHGKGQGILRTGVRNWLVQVPEVLAFCEAKPNEGGSGAVIVLLKISGNTD